MHGGEGWRRIGRTPQSRRCREWLDVRVGQELRRVVAWNENEGCNRDVRDTVLPSRLPYGCTQSRENGYSWSAVFLALSNILTPHRIYFLAILCPRPVRAFTLPPRVSSLPDFFSFDWRIGEFSSLVAAKFRFITSFTGSFSQSLSRVTGYFFGTGRGSEISFL